jgi:fatty-acyl-CoA synthase
MFDEVWQESLSPLSFLERSALVYPEKVAIAYNELSYTYAEFRARALRLAAALEAAGIQAGDRVACLLPNIPAMLEAHFGPMYIGATLVALNTRLSPGEIAQILNHSGSKILVYDADFASSIQDIADQAPCIKTLIHVREPMTEGSNLPGHEYESFLASAPAQPYGRPTKSELETIAINYTSGTTGMPKGVQYHGRGAYLNALGMLIELGLNADSTYLWTLPMFHCNGWCYTWAVTAIGGTHVCLKRVEPAEVFRLIEVHSVTHLCAAPTVLTSLYSSPSSHGRDLSRVTMGTAGAPPSPQLIRSMWNLGATIVHLYGLTETFGPTTVCAVQPNWKLLSIEERAKMEARQGVPHPLSGMQRVVNENMQDVPRDGQTMGEVVMRGNIVMSGYFGDPEGTAKAFEGGWYHSGDLAVWHPDGYIELQDRSKDIIISGGENISTQQIEKVLMEHPSVLEVSVIGVPDEKWGEVPKAFIVTKEGAPVSDIEIMEFCRQNIAHFKCPKSVEFGDLPKTATGKIQKYILREREWAGQKKRIQ